MSGIGVVAACVETKEADCGREEKGEGVDPSGRWVSTELGQDLQDEQDWMSVTEIEKSII